MVNFSRNPSMPRSFSPIGAMRHSVRISPVNLSPSNDDATAPCASHQNVQSFSCEVKAPKSSRSPTVQTEDPRITTCARSQNGFPKNAGRYMKTLITSTGSELVTRRVRPSRNFCGARCPLSSTANRTGAPPGCKIELRPQLCDRYRTPKAFANSSPALECSDNAGVKVNKMRNNPERVPLAANPFQG